MKKYDFDVVYERKDSEKWMELKRKFGVEGLVSLWEADMDFISAEPIVAALTERAQNGIYGYVHKTPSYNQAISQWVKKKHDFEIKEEWILHSPMVMTAIVIYLRLFCNAEEKVVFQTPIYYPFYEVVKNVERDVLFNPLIYNEDNCRYEMDFDNLEEQFRNGGKIFILCNPHNPAGMVWTKEELKKVGDLCMKYGVKVIADEAHADFALTGYKYTPFASISQEFAQNTMTLLSPGKTFNLAGTHQAVVVIPNKEMRESFAKQIGMLDIEKNNCFSLVAVEAGYRYGEEWLEQVVNYIESNMEFVIEFCNLRIPQIKATRPEGTYLMWLDCRELYTDGPSLGNFMVNKAKVGLCEGYWFGEQGAGFERLNVACPRKTLLEGLERIEKAVKDEFPNS